MGEVMALLQWNDSFSTGITAVDHEHRAMIALINELHATLVRDRSDPAIEEFLGEVHTRIAAHFALEEQVMRKGGYRALDEHKADHERLLDEIRVIIDDFEADPQLDETAFSKRLDAWFSEHFRTHDARLHETRENLTTR